MSLNADSRRRIAAAAKMSTRRSAEDRRCPRCARKSALSRSDDGAGTRTTHCRWCKWTRVRSFDGETMLTAADPTEFTDPVEIARAEKRRAGGSR